MLTSAKSQTRTVRCTGLAILSLYCSWNLPPAIFWYYLRYANRKFYAKNWTSLRGARVFANDLFDFAAFPIENVWKMAKNRVFWKKTYQNRLETTFWYIKSTLHVSLHPSRLFKAFPKLRMDLPVTYRSRFGLKSEWKTWFLTISWFLKTIKMYWYQNNYPLARD